jgi:hypothetical protein
MLRKFSATLLLAVAIAAAGCDNDIENAPGPTDPNPTVTETFTGSITPNGAATHQFVVLASGDVTARITEITPDPAITIGFVLGTWSGSSCQTVIFKDEVAQGEALIGRVTGQGVLCVRVHDPNGKLTAPLTYSLSVEHP